MTTVAVRNGGAPPAAPPGVTAPADLRDTGDAAGRRLSWWQRMRQRMTPPPEDVQDQLEGLLAVLEAARAELAAGWVQGGWWAVGSAGGGLRLVDDVAAAGGRPGHVDGACLVGALARGAPEAGRAVDVVYDALWAARGQPGQPGGVQAGGVQAGSGLPPVSSPMVRLARARVLIQWNDRPGRTKAEVLALVDQAISATIMNLVSARPASRLPAMSSP